MKRSDPAVYKAYLVLLITLLDVVRSVLRRVKERVRVSVATGPGRGSRLQLAVVVLFVMLVGVFSVVLSLLIIAGDVELNPGPPKGRKNVNHSVLIGSDLLSPCYARY